MYYQTRWIPTNTAAAPATIVLTREEIARATITYGFTEEMTTNVCPISLEPLQLGDVICEIRGCGHKFKRPNLMTWLNRNSNCPVCRYDLRAPLPQPPAVGEEQNNNQEGEDDDESEYIDEDEVEDASGNDIRTSELSQELQNSLTQIIQNLVQNTEVSSLISDSSSTLLYEFQFPLYNTRESSSIINNDFDNEDFIQDEIVD
jgi:hypothetical protein